MPTADEYRAAIQGFRQSLRDAKYQRGVFKDSEQDPWLDIALVIHTDVVLEGLLDKAPFDPPQFRQIASQIRALPLVSKIVADHPYIAAVDQKSYVGDLDVLEFKLAEMLDYRPSLKREAPRRSRARAELTGKRRRVPNVLRSRERAFRVAKVWHELRILRPQLHGDPSDHERLRKENPGFMTFRVARGNESLTRKILNVGYHRKFLRLAQEIVAADSGCTLSTIQTDWKKRKPKEFRQNHTQS